MIRLFLIKSEDKHGIGVRFKYTILIAMDNILMDKGKHKEEFLKEQISKTALTDIKFNGGRILSMDERSSVSF